MDKQWRGWSSPTRTSGRGWVEISHRLHADLARIPLFDKPEFRRAASMPEHPYNLTEIHMVCHFGTHVDAPCHFIPDGPAMHEIPLDRLCGEGVVWHIATQPYGVIEPEHFERAHPRASPGDIVLLDTGWAQDFESVRYGEHPCLSVAAAQWLVDHGIKLVGVDLMTPDLAVNRRPKDFGWPVHHMLLGQGVLIAENLTNLTALAGQRVEVMLSALNIVGADGAPARALARPLA